MSGKCSTCVLIEKRVETKRVEGSRRIFARRVVARRYGLFDT